MSAEGKLEEGDPVIWGRAESNWDFGMAKVKRFVRILVVLGSVLWLGRPSNTRATSLPPGYSVTLRLAGQHPCTEARPSTGRWIQCGISLKNLIAIAYNVPIDRIMFTGLTLGGTPYDVAVRYPDSEREEFRKALQHALEASLKLEAHYESRTVQAIILSGTLIAPESPALYGKMDISATGIKAEGVTTKDLAHALEIHFDLPALDETGFRGGPFSISVHTDGQESLELWAAAFKHTGLTLTKQERTLTYLIVDRLVQQ